MYGRLLLFALLVGILAGCKNPDAAYREDAAHAFFDWKPDQETKDIFAQYGVPYAADMMRFFDEVFYK